MMNEIAEFLNRGGPALWAIGALSVITLALILWKLWQLTRLGAWRGQKAQRAVDLWVAGEREAALSSLSHAAGLRAGVVRSAMQALGQHTKEEAREDTARVARRALSDSRDGLRALELIMTIAPLIGLLGTVLGMIDAFQALQDSGNRADPAALAGGIWEALLTTAAGMGVAIPAGIALSWFDSLSDRVALDIEDLATRIFVAAP